MSIIHRIQRWRGKDTTIEREHRLPIRDYKITHLNGEVSEVRAHGYNLDGAFARFYTYDGVRGSDLLGYGAWSTDQNIVRVLEGIQEIQEITLGETVYRATFDLADGTVVDTDIENPI